MCVHCFPWRLVEPSGKKRQHDSHYAHRVSHLVVVKVVGYSWGLSSDTAPHAPKINGVLAELKVEVEKSVLGCLALQKMCPLLLSPSNIAFCFKRKFVKWLCGQRSHLRWSSLASSPGPLCFERAGVPPAGPAWVCPWRHLLSPRHLSRVPMAN